MLPNQIPRLDKARRSRTFPGDHRSFDILHVATALELGAKQFLTFDGNQLALASSEGLAAPLVTSD